MEGRRNALREHVNDVVVGVTAVVKLGAKGVLPLLCGNLAERIRCVKKKALELQFTHTCDGRPHLKGQVSIRLV